jgi:hypothetical protein
MQRGRLTRFAGTTAAISAAVLVSTAGLASAEPARPSPGAGMDRMHELMQQGNPGMQRMHALMQQGNPGMQRMHNHMMSADAAPSR